MSGSNYQVNLVFHCIERIAPQRGLVVFQVETILTLQPRDQLQTQLTNQPIHQTHRFISLPIIYLGGKFLVQNSLTASNQTIFTGWNHLQPLDWPLPRCELQRKANPMTRVERDVHYIVDTGSNLMLVYSKRCPTTTQMSWSQPVMMECKQKYSYPSYIFNAKKIKLFCPQS